MELHNGCHNEFSYNVLRIRHKFYIQFSMKPKSNYTQILFNLNVKVKTTSQKT